MWRSGLILMLLFTMTVAAGEPGAIEGSVFLPESGWNREERVLQYNSFFLGDETALEITSEWIAGSPAHQLSWTVPIFNDGGTGFGDATLHYRYQLARSDRAAAAARVSLILPTRSARFGPSATGVELALPVSVTPHERLTLHGTLAGRMLDDGRRESALQGAFAFSMTRRIAWIVDSSLTVAPGSRDVVVRPGVQFSFEAGGMRFAPAVTLPLGHTQESSVLVVLGVEHDL